MGAQEQTRRRAARVRVVLVALLSSVVVSLGVVPAAQAAPRRDVVANLWEWNWSSVANECTTVLGPQGYGAVQVAPPQDSLSRSGPEPVHPWWEVYQPVDYNLTSRMGDESQFRSMVNACRRAGVRVIVDAVINHMTGQGDVSYGGVHYSKYEYDGLYTSDDFHHTPADCPTTGDILDFNDYLQVTKCELVSLSDLRTESERVRATLAQYLNKLLGYGVSGFRVDAAKHIGQADLAAIESRLDPTVDGRRPYIALEVPPGGPGKLSPWAFRSVGDLLGFDFATQIRDAFKSYITPPGGNITELEVFGRAAGLLPSNATLVFVQNHDTERNGSTLSYKDGALNVLATQFMLAYGYGRPQVYSSFTFTGNDDSPPSDANGFISNTDCSNGWTCNDRLPAIAHMVRWHNYVRSHPVANWYDDGVDFIAFSRGDRGWIAINNEDGPKTVTVATGLRAGTYCDVIHNTSFRGTCTGPGITVDTDGSATVTVPAHDTLAFTARDAIHE